MTIRQRQEAIIRSLRRKGTTTISELAQEVGTSRRTVLRDLTALRDEGFVIYSEPGRGGGIQLDPHSVQTTVRLSVAEVFALVISVSSVYAIGGVPFTGLADVALSKIEKSLPSDKLHDLRRLLDCLYIGTLAPQVNLTDMGDPDSSLLPEFEAAFLKQCPLRFCYRDAKKVVTERYVEPQAMLILPPLWYLVAWDPSRQGFRHFRMDRISHPRIIEGETFKRRHVPFDEHVSPVRNFAHSVKVVP
ncbi:WYL domain-containing protein [Vibrio aquaticus]|uniref:WYL domain-containing protein n=1 Tax=Vibrio aquaticus TaxID=2496559 RepID=A0A3S0N8B7_9VIBR|nr:WYL domain-containing protein [Vibrio aquaticus]RTZ18261.1 WYL domain-containing protein [Vibrio aquaticus]